MFDVFVDVMSLSRVVSVSPVAALALPCFSFSQGLFSGKRQQDYGDYGTIKRAKQRLCKKSATSAVKQALKPGGGAGVLCDDGFANMVCNITFILCLGVTC